MKRILWVWIACVVLCLIIVGAVLLYKASHTEGNPLWLISKLRDSNYHPTVLTVPEPKLPSPNGFVTLVKAGAALKDSARIAAASTAQSALSPATVRQLIGENTAALSLFQTGLTQPYLHPAVRSLDTKFPYLTQWRNLARLLALDAHTRATRGDWSGATQRSQDIIQFGAVVPHGGTLMLGLLGVAIQEIGYRELWPCVKHLTAAQAREAVRRVSDITATRESPADILQDEMYWAYAGTKAKEIDQAPNSQARRLQEILLGLYVQDMRQTIANVRLPYAQQSPLQPLHGMWSEILAPDARKFAAKMTSNQVGEELLLVALALRAYADEHAAQYPVSLTDLVPAYLPRIPDDSFALNKTSYRYTLHGATYQLYSVGPDGRDDSGLPFKNPPGPHGKPGASSISDDSKGDIVAQNAAQ
jgi:hypothetical protein